jgi:DNA polymerase-1
MTHAQLPPHSHLVLIDGSSYIFRAYHALPPLTRKSDGLPIGAVAGFCNMLWKLIRAQTFDPKPTHIAVVFDRSEQTFRKEFYPDYKAHRPPAPEDLVPQFPLIRHATRAFDLMGVEQAGFEADDLIATYARLAAEAGACVTIVGSDKDLMQLVNGNVRLFDPVKEKMIGALEVNEKFGVNPDKVVDVQALIGDSTDNIPGVPGIGVKTAAQLIADFGDLESLLARTDEIKQPKRRESLVTYAEQARISYRLATLETNVPLDVPLDDLTLIEPDPRTLVAFLKAMEFATLTRRVGEATGIDISQIEPDAALKGTPKTALPPAPQIQVATDLFSGCETQHPVAKPEPGAAPRAETTTTPQHLAAKRAIDARSTAFDRSRYECVLTLENLEKWVARAFDSGVVAIDTETTGLDSMKAELVGVSLALAPNEACYIPLSHCGGDDLLSGGRLPEQICLEDAVKILAPLLANPAVLKIGQNIKYDMMILKRHGCPIIGYDDTMLLSYALDAGLGGHGMDELALRHLGHTCISYDDITGTGKKRTCFSRVELEKATAYAAEDADVTFRLWQMFKARLAAEGMTTVYETLERPLPAVLQRMEKRGISIDRTILARLSGEMAVSMAALEKQVHLLAGESFNLGSPKQLGDILFDKMALPGGTKTKTGAWATGASALEDLAAAGHELPRRLLEWRQMAKLKSTYTDALPTFVHPDTQRVHTSFALAATTTGRLSSSEPNIQNIPIRTEEGRKIRTAFIALPGHKLISADYSQIELRLLAHIADIPQLKQAFADGLDIHAMTASEMFGVPVEGMESSVRRRAKAINFGIIYGISAFGLANQLSIGREEAGQYIKTYFERFPGIRDYMESTKAFAREHGFVTTVFGRRCHYPQIASKNPAERAFMERAAINAPIQGSAADIIRRAMSRMDKALSDAGLKAQMLLQVHDELIFEVADSEIEATISVVRHTMQEASLPAIALSVPLQVDARAAQNWDEAH